MTTTFCQNEAMVESYLFKNCQLVLPDRVVQGDILIRDGRIHQIAPSIHASAQVIINDTGLTVMPGGIDTHVHFREPGLTHKETIHSGSKAAVSGGVTSFFDMPNTHPPTVTTAELALKKDRAKASSYANYNFYIGATRTNLDDITAVDNCPGIKIFMGSSTGNMLVDDPGVLDNIFRHARVPIVVHSEDETIISKNRDRFADRLADRQDPMDHMRIRSPEAALACTQRAVALAKRHQQRLHILHLTTADEVYWLMSQSLPSYITCEVCIQHLLLHAPDAYERWGTLAQINPPIRSKAHADRLWYGLKQGIISSVVTDHAPHTLEEKCQPFGQAPSGMPGVETLLPLMLEWYHDQRASLTQISHWVSGAPQRLFNIRDRGQLIPGTWADLAVFDLNGSMTIQNNRVVSASGWSAFDGTTVRSRPIMTLVNGQMVYREGDWTMVPDNAREIMIG